MASPAYQWVQGGVVLLLLMLVDAGFSRDWSRIGVLTTDQEDQLQSVSPHFLCAGRARCGSLAGSLQRAVCARGRGCRAARPTPLPVPLPLPSLQVAAAVGTFHLLCAVPAATVSLMRGEAWAPRTAKVLAVGFLALLEVLLLPAAPAAADEGRQQ